MGLEESWLKSRELPEPLEFEPIKTYLGSPKARWMRPEDMMDYLRAESPMDLLRGKYLKGNEGVEYPTVGFNIMRHPLSDLSNQILLSREEPEKRYDLPLYGIKEYAQERYPEIPEPLKKYIPQAIYEHEYRHFQDVRQPPFKNYGYMTRWGMPGEMAAREIPAMKSEDLFWTKKAFESGEIGFDEYLDRMMSILTYAQEYE